MKRLFFLLLLVFNAQGALAETASESLAKQLKSVCAFSSDFTQEVLGEKDIVVQRAVGHMQFDRCHHSQGLFYWRVISPNASTMYFRDRNVIYLDQDLNQATLQKVNYQDPKMLPLMLLIGDANSVLNHFFVTSKDQRHYLLRPKLKNKDDLLLGVVLDFNSKGAIEKIQYQTNLGPKTQITFDHGRVNEAIKEALFFEALPKGTDIVNVE